MRRRTKVAEIATQACGESLLGANIAMPGTAVEPPDDLLDERRNDLERIAGYALLVCRSRAIVAR
ncbi:hypothetical protein OG874_28745 [Nocardia sp. NBC_00565]|uniref:hypothetical protein n=1 Tax=Nocardia sp. NBC_00565 TaxID=2975993 RepID=UPI002E814E93|nr:hypothetical protein [Nocardia sp. NBC_00565]WUC00813.1 hypothetical protein OG874_28745 [Nocardia sp. NBC_00565]